MSDTVAQLIAGVILIGVAGIAAFIAYRVGHSHGVRQALLLDEEARHGRQEEEAERRQERPPRPPAPPTVVH